MTNELLERWLEDVVATPGLTSVGDRLTAREVLLDDALKALPLLRGSAGAIVDVGSGGGSPGIPLAVALPERTFTLLEAERRKCEFLERVASDLANVSVVWGRAETQSVDTYGVVLARALAKPPVATELCLPLVRPDGLVVLWVGQSADSDSVQTVARLVGGELEQELPGLLVLRKLRPTPPGYPRRPGLAKKRPLA